MKGTMVAWGGGLERIQRTTDTWRIRVTSIVLRWEWQDTTGEIRETGKKLLHKGHREEIKVYKLQNKQNLRYK